MVRLAGEGSRLKPCALTSSSKVVVSVMEPETPVMVTRDVLRTEELRTFRISMLPVAEGFVVQLAVTPVGNPEADRVTLPVNPPLSVTSILTEATLPGLMATRVEEAARSKPAAVVGASELMR